MRQVYYIVGFLATLIGIFIIASNISEPGWDGFNAGALLIVLGQLGYIQGNQHHET